MIKEQTLIMISEENLIELAIQICKRVSKDFVKSKWVHPKEAEYLLNVKRQTILKLYEQGEIDLTWIGADNTKVWQASRASIEKYLEKKKNYNLKNQKL